MNGYLILETGQCFTGKGLGATTANAGNIAVSTTMVSYEDSLTDPSNTNRILVMTFPLIGNVGISADDFYAPTAPKGLIISECCTHPSHHQAQSTVATWCRHKGVPAIQDIDTRNLLREVRNRSINAAIVTTHSELSSSQIEHYANWAKNSAQSSAPVFRTRPYTIYGSSNRIAILDAGIRPSLVSHLAHQGFHLNIIPATAGAQSVHDLKPDLVLIAGGPSTADTMTQTVTTLSELIGSVPLFGVGLGMELICTALGSSSLPDGKHYGWNYPVKTNDNRTFLTFQDHSALITRQSLEGTELIPLQTHIGDDTVEAIKHKTLPIAACHYHPEVGGDEAAQVLNSALPFPSQLPMAAEAGA